MHCNYVESLLDNYFFSNMKYMCILEMHVVLKINHEIKVKRAFISTYEFFIIFSFLSV